MRYHTACVEEHLPGIDYIGGRLVYLVFTVGARYNCHDDRRLTSEVDSSAVRKPRAICPGCSAVYGSIVFMSCIIGLPQGRDKAK